MSVVDIMLERETANDETATVVAVFVKSGTPVEKDEVLFDIENSKATQEVVATAAGVLTHQLTVGDVVAFGVPIAQISPADMQPKDAPQIAPPAVAQEIRPAPPVLASPVLASPVLARIVSPIPAPPSAPSLSPFGRPIRDEATAFTKQRFSHAAAAMIAELGLGAVSFKPGFVTKRDVLACSAPALSPPRQAPALNRLGVSPSGKPVSGRKRAEIEALSQGAGATMLSVLGIGIGHLEVARHPSDFVSGIIDLVIYEASRLMRKYPRLNAAYADGFVQQHDAVHAGFAIDSGGQLVVYGIENADQISLPALAETIADAVARYTANALTAAEMSRATFTVTDLSADELDFVLPLLPRGQSCIIGITRADSVGYRLFAGFDHRVTEGREVSAFLGELRQRLQSFATQKSPQSASSSPCCFYCDRSVDDAVTRTKDKGLLKMVGRDGGDILCCVSCFNGW